MNIITNLLPKEVKDELKGFTAGTILSTISFVAMECFDDLIIDSYTNPLSDLAFYALEAGAIIGIALVVFSAARAAFNLFSKKYSLKEACTTTAISFIVSTALRTIGNQLLAAAPFSYGTTGTSFVYTLLINLSWQATLIAGLGVLAFSIGAAYHVAKAFSGETAPGAA